MSLFGEESLPFDSSRFSGVARVFPLPDLVLFPHIVQPLHVFESRYREMAEEAVAGDGLIAMATLSPGWEHDYESRPPVETFGCLGRIVTHHRFEDGRYNLLLLGLRRVRFGAEIDPPRSFRRARVELIDDLEPTLASCDCKALRDRVTWALKQNLPHGEPPEMLQTALDEALPLGVLCDLAAYTLPIARSERQRLLGEADVLQRTERLLSLIETGPAAAESPLAAGSSPYPPRFSKN
ncbi:LON peptidase substrate-binding domain-containing protein [Pseudobythopirellula maris]|uniref:LON peptidase substrate-binding domain-containing protein n=1 Tax=Pseudobythopirellula maris TaxID=2527991 RepID=UPI0018D35008|nr:LON peptidase substrate-binding domain-containing protein [Pseudobythopirellula maris]